MNGGWHMLTRSWTLLTYWLNLFHLVNYVRRLYEWCCIIFTDLLSTNPPICQNDNIEQPLFLFLSSRFSFAFLDTLYLHSLSFGLGIRAPVFLNNTCAIESSSLEVTDFFTIVGSISMSRWDTSMSHWDIYSPIIYERYIRSGSASGYFSQCHKLDL